MRYNICKRESARELVSRFWLRARAYMVKLKARAVGNSTGLTLPKEVTDRLKIEVGDTVYLTESPEGYKLTPYNPEFERQMALAESIMVQYRDALRELAK